MSYLGTDPNTTGGNQRINLFSGNGVQTAFTLSAAPASANNCDVSISGVVRVPGQHYTVSGNVITFLTAPAGGSPNNIAVRYGADLPQVGSIPSDSSITNAKINAALVVPVANGGTGANDWQTAQINLKIDGVLANPAMKNRLLNGSFDVAQQGTSFAAIASGKYSLDKWCTSYSTTAVMTVSQSQNVPADNEFQNSLRMQVTTLDSTISSGDFAIQQQGIEGYLVRDLIGKTFVLSFWVRSTVTGTFSVSFSNSNNDKSYVTTYTVDTTDTWEKKSVVVTGGLITAGTWAWTTGLGLSVRFCLAAGASYQGATDSWLNGNYMAASGQANALSSTSNNFYITGVQLEYGDTATRFDHRMFSTELSSCKRYLEKNTIPPNYTGIPGGTYGFNGYTYTVEKRATPTTTYSGLQYYSGSTPTSFTPNIGISTTQTFTVGLNGAVDWRGIASGVTIANADFVYA